MSLQYNHHAELNRGKTVMSTRPKIFFDNRPTLEDQLIQYQDEVIKMPQTASIF